MAWKTITTPVFVLHLPGGVDIAELRVYGTVKAQASFISSKATCESVQSGLIVALRYLHLACTSSALTSSGAARQQPAIWIIHYRAAVVLI